ncbi:hypothetical protein ISCGN_003496 [Ixodes scapularis]
MASLFFMYVGRVLSEIMFLRYFSLGKGALVNLLQCLYLRFEVLLWVIRAPARHDAYLDNVSCAATDNAPLLSNVGVHAHTEEQRRETVTVRKRKAATARRSIQGHHVIGCHGYLELDVGVAKWTE